MYTEAEGGNWSERERRPCSTGGGRKRQELENKGGICAQGEQEEGIRREVRIKLKGSHSAYGLLCSHWGWRHYRNGTNSVVPRKVNSHCKDHLPSYDWTYCPILNSDMDVHHQINPLSTCRWPFIPNIYIARRIWPPSPSYVSGRI